MRSSLKVFCFVTLAAMLFASCASDPDAGSIGITESAPAEESIETEADYLSELPETDLEGREFTVLSRNTTERLNFYTEELTGDVFNDSLRERDLQVEERLNVRIKNIATADSGETKNYVVKTALADDPVYDLFYLNMTGGISTMVGSNHIINLRELPYLKLDSAWWNKSINENMDLYGKLYFSAGSISGVYLLTPIAMMFNKQMARDYIADNLYDIVKDGKWTVDKLHELTKDVAADVDGNGIMDTEDKYGLAVEPTFGFALYAAGGFKGVEIDGKGEYKIHLDSPESVDFIQKCSGLFKDRNSVFVRPVGAGEAHADIFEAGRALFTDFTILGVFVYFRDMEQDFGLIPIPKKDIAQDRYLTTCNTYLDSAVAVPVTIRDFETTGLVMETMAYISRLTVVPAIYETTLRGKVSRDEDSSVMLDIIYADTSYDLNTIFDFGVNIILLANSLCGNNENFVSSYEEISLKVVSAVEDLLETLKQ